jgi:DNA repair exonuclease SbcCD ATPase subunit
MKYSHLIHNKSMHVRWFWRCPLQLNLNHQFNEEVFKSLIVKVKKKIQEQSNGTSVEDSKDFSKVKKDWERKEQPKDVITVHGDALDEFLKHAKFDVEFVRESVLDFSISAFKPDWKAMVKAKFSEHSGNKESNYNEKYLTVMIECLQDLRKEYACLTGSHLIMGILSGLGSRLLIWLFPEVWVQALFILASHIITIFDVEWQLVSEMMKDPTKISKLLIKLNAEKILEWFKCRLWPILVFQIRIVCAVFFFGFPVLFGPNQCQVPFLKGTKMCLRNTPLYRIDQHASETKKEVEKLNQSFQSMSNTLESIQSLGSTNSEQMGILIRSFEQNFEEARLMAQRNLELLIQARLELQQCQAFAEKSSQTTYSEMKAKEKENEELKQMINEKEGQIEKANKDLTDLETARRNTALALEQKTTAHTSCTEELTKMNRRTEKSTTSHEKSLKALEERLVSEKDKVVSLGSRISYLRHQLETEKIDKAHFEALKMESEPSTWAEWLNKDEFWSLRLEISSLQLKLQSCESTLLDMRVVTHGCSKSNPYN